MAEKKVLKEADVSFKEVKWGRTKELVGPATAGSAHVKVNITEYAPGRPHELHLHPGQEEVIFILSGEGYTESYGRRRELSPGSVVYIPADTEHATMTAGSEPMTALIVKGPPEERRDEGSGRDL